ncbi:nuclear mRNA export, poly(A)+RNA binding protein [Malassezia japonica]|uniref:mRNA export factor MEX67 n=1 Tax=Malassezia japonica TaxID=223818 RepID=A0AAF0F394_9BASI|nr:nuclear mRNA export, poly(A)+RNA binding protein [Malassezia japonica]WFD39624.1 nuclear mRNA export, poly(A)+RNA binding protein [Malassezia japonica]
MPKRTQRQPLVAGALRSAGLIEKDAQMPVDDEEPGLKRQQRRRLAREAADPVGKRPPRRGGVNINSLARPANQARGKLADRVGATPDVAPQTNVVQTLRTFLQQRWDANACLLNLDNMQQDPLLTEANIRPPGAQGAHKDLGTAMWKLSGEMFPTLSTLSLANNALSSLQPLATLGQYLPKLANLSLEQNELRWVRDLDVLASKKHGLGNLQELLLMGNPMQQNAVDAGNEDGYRRDVLAKFPSLSILDRRPVTDVEHGFSQLFRGRASKKAGPEAAQVPLRNFPLQIKGGFVDGDAAQVVPEFLSLFFSRYDQDRSALAPVYAPNARFSYAINASPPPRARAERLMHTMPHQKELVLDRYIDLGSRNILRSHNTKALLRNLHHGSSAIVAFLQRMPKTAHPLHDASKFVVDAWVLPNVDVQAQTSQAERPDALLYITVHGEFSEAPSNGIRSFDRVFVVAPAAPNSEAVQNGWPCTIVSDAMTIRHYSKADAWRPDSLPVGPVDAPAVPAAPSAVPGAAPAAAPAAAAGLPPYLQNQEPLPGLSPEQHALSLQLAAQTRLTYPFAVQCLVENAWDATQALARFSMLQAQQSIPPEAFVPM